MKTVVITGSTRGIGFGLADAFLELDCQVVVSGRAQASVEKAIADLSARNPGAGSARIAGYPCDVTRFDQVQALWDAARARFGAIDIWINNAGISNRVKNYWDLDPEEVRGVVETNILGSMYGTTVALRGMLAQGHGALYNLEGLGSRDGRKVKGLSVYGTTKAALRYFTEAVALDTAGTPVIAGVILPGMVITDMITSQYVDRPQEWQQFRRILNIIADRVETVAPWIARQVLANTRNGARIQWITGTKLMARFLTAPFHKRHVV